MAPGNRSLSVVTVHKLEREIMRALSFSLALPLFFGGVSAQEKPTPEKTVPEASFLRGQQADKRVEKDVTTQSQDDSAPSIKDQTIAHGKWVLKNGALYLRLAGALIPVPGGGASGCFGYPPLKASDGEKPTVDLKKTPGE